jgi:hypothetical protein
LLKIFAENGSTGKIFPADGWTGHTEVKAIKIERNGEFGVALTELHNISEPISSMIMRGPSYRKAFEELINKIKTNKSSTIVLYAITPEFKTTRGHKASISP